MSQLSTDKETVFPSQEKFDLKKDGVFRFPNTPFSIAFSTPHMAEKKNELLQMEESIKKQEEELKQEVERLKQEHNLASTQENFIIANTPSTPAFVISPFPVKHPTQEDPVFSRETGYVKQKQLELEERAKRIVTQRKRLKMIASKITSADRISRFASHFQYLNQDSEVSGTLHEQNESNSEDSQDQELFHQYEEKPDNPKLSASPDLAKSAQSDQNGICEQEIKTFKNRKHFKSNSLESEVSDGSQELENKGDEQDPIMGILPNEKIKKYSNAQRRRSKKSLIHQSSTALKLHLLHLPKSVKNKKEIPLFNKKMKAEIN